MIGTEVGVCEVSQDKSVCKAKGCDLSRAEIRLICVL